MKRSDQICILAPGVYTDASTSNPGRVVIRDKEVVTIIENRDDKFVIAMVDNQTMILVHKDSIEKIDDDSFKKGNENDKR